GAYNTGVSATFTSSDPNFNNASGTGALTVIRENARATYTGALFAWTKSTTDGSATVTLSATIQDITAVTGDPAYDAYAGDIRNATVTFVQRTGTSDIVIGTAPIGLVNTGDTKTGTATLNWTANIGSADSVQYTIGIIVGSYYIRNDSDDDSVVTVSKPLGGGFITGGGYLIMQNSVGFYPGGPGTKSNFGFNVKNDKTGPKGNINTIIRNNGRVYQIKGNA